MVGKSLFKKIISLIIMTAVLASCAACSGVVTKTHKLGSDDVEIPKATREDAFKAVVQSTVNKYGILDEEKAEKSYDLENVTGLWEAKTFDITGDGENELFLVYLDNSEIEMQAYEYKNGIANKEWSDTSEWGGIFNLSFTINDEIATWVTYESNATPRKMYTYKDGQYTGVDGHEIEGYFSIGPNPNPEALMLGALARELDIEDEYNAGGARSIISLSGMGTLQAADTETLISRWDLNITQKRISPAESLSDIQYYGDIEKCKMTKEMALAYAEAIENQVPIIEGNSGEQFGLYGALMDLSDDGMPILVTVIASENGGFVFPMDGKYSIKVWGWNGENAEEYNFYEDMSLDFFGGIHFAAYPGSGRIYIDEGYLFYDESTYGQLEYEVSNAQISLINHETVYCAAESYEDERFAFCEDFPGADSERFENEMRVARISDLLDAGWIDIGVSPQSGSRYYCIRVLNGDIKPFTSVSNYKQWTYDGYSMSGEVISLFENQAGELFYKDGTMSRHYSAISALNAYSKVAGKPFYNYEEVSGTLTDKQIEAIAKKAAEKVKGEVGEIYKLSDDLYLVIIYVDGEVSGSVILKNTENGKNWRIVKSDKKAMAEDTVSSEVNKDSKTSNIKIDLSKANEGTQYLKDVLGSIDGSKPNNTAKEQIADFVEAAISQSSRINIKAKDNKVTINKKDISKAAESAANANSEYAKLLKDNGISLNKSTTVIIFVIVENVDSGKAMQVTFDKDMVNALADGNEVMLILGDSNCSIKVTKADLKAILKKHGKLTVTIKKSKDNSYEIQFADKDGKLIEKLKNSITFALPANDELCTIEAQYTGGTDNWGGQFDSTQKTLSFATPYSGTYTVIEETIDIADIDNLSEEYQKAIRFMVSKGYFNLEDGNFNPYGSLNRYAFSEALVRIFFALDRDAKASFSDVAEDDQYYPYVASGENANIIEGYEDGTFRGINDVLIEEVLALCSRTLKEYKGYVEPEEPSEYLHFTDNDMISDWAESEIAIDVREGLIDDGGMLHPQSTISRAESALLLYRLFMLLYEVEPVAVIADSGLGSADTMILILGGAIGLLIIAIGVLVVILMKKRSKASAMQDASNENSAEPTTNSEAAADTEPKDK